MPKIYVCDGCGKDINADLEMIFPQKEKNYCQKCNKVYWKFDEGKKDIYAKYDKLKWADTAELRREVFGEGVPKYTDAEIREAKKEIIGPEAEKMARINALRKSTAEKKSSETAEVKP